MVHTLPYLSIKMVSRIVMIKKADAWVILEQANRYRHYQETLAKIRRINKEIDELLEQVKSATTRSYP